MELHAMGDYEVCAITSTSSIGSDEESNTKPTSITRSTTARRLVVNVRPADILHFRLLISEPNLCRFKVIILSTN